MAETTYNINTGAFRKGMLNIVGEKYLTIKGKNTSLKRACSGDFLNVTFRQPLEDDGFVTFGKRLYVAKAGEFFSENFCEGFDECIREYFDSNKIPINENARFSDNITVVAAVMLSQKENTENQFKVYCRLEIADSANDFDDEFYSYYPRGLFSTEAWTHHDNYIPDRDLVEEIEGCKRKIIDNVPGNPEQLFAFAKHSLLNPYILLPSFH